MPGFIPDRIDVNNLERVLMAHLADPKYNPDSNIICADRVIVKHMYSRKPSSVQNVLIYLVFI